MMGRFILALMIFSAAEGWNPEAVSAQEAAKEPAVSQRSLLEEILKRPAYQRWKLRQELEEKPNEESYIAGLARAALKSLWEGIKSAFKWLKSVFENVRWSLPSVPGESFSVKDALRKGAWGAFFIMLLLAGMYLYRARGRMAGGLKLARVLSREKIRQALDSADALALDSREWMAMAGRMEAQGDFRSMYRAVYLALLSGLHERGAIDFRKNRTNWAYADSFKGLTQEKTEFILLTELFDQVWYGLKTPADASITQLKSRAGALLAKEAAG